jgi:hypothetical protein
MSTLPISHGTHTITTHFSNLGGTSNSSPINTLEVDTIAPTIVPTIISPASGSTLSQKRPTITGTGESNGIVFTTINGVTYTGASDIGGNWTIIPTNDIPDGTYNVFVRFEDKAGNPAPAVSNTIRITIKTAAPSTPIIQNPYQNAVINSAIPTFQ